MIYISKSGEWLDTTYAVKDIRAGVMTIYVFFHFGQLNGFSGSFGPSQSRLKPTSISADGGLVDWFDETSADFSMSIAAVWTNGIGDDLLESLLVLSSDIHSLDDSGIVN